jgi:hypothetical protein
MRQRHESRNRDLVYLLRFENHVSEKFIGSLAALYRKKFLNVTEL